MNRALGWPERLPFLDLLRFLAMLAVLLYHYGFRGAVSGTYLQVAFPEIGTWSRYGFVALNLFFLISGFVIPMTVEASGSRASHFVASRVARLYPVFWIAATLTFLLVYGRPAPFGVSVTDYLLNLSLVPAWFGAMPVDGVYWTLAADLQFYAYVVVYLMLLKRYLSIDALFAAWLAVLVSEWIFPGQLAWLHPISLSDWAGSLFIAGGVFYRVWRNGWTVTRMAMIAVTCLLASAATRDHAKWIADWTGEAVSVPIAVALNASLFAIFAVLSAHRTSNAWGGPGAVALGAITYPLYLLHQKVGYLLINFSEPFAGRWAALALAIACVFAGAALLHAIVERPCNRRVRAWLEPRLWFLDALAGDASQPGHLPRPAGAR